MEVTFLKNAKATVSTGDDGGSEERVLYVKGSTEDLPGPSAERWIRRGVAAAADSKEANAAIAEAKAEAEQAEAAAAEDDAEKGKPKKSAKK